MSGWTLINALLLASTPLVYGFVDNSCCSPCPLYQGLLIEPGCEECQKRLYVTVDQEVQVRCSPCNSTFARAMNQKRNGQLTWSIYPISNTPNATIMEARTTRGKSIAKISWNSPGIYTLNCEFKDHNKTLFSGHKDVVVCGKLKKPEFKCESSILHDSRHVLATKCSWKVREHESTYVDNRTASLCALNYGHATLVSHDGGYEGPILVENDQKPCGIHNLCVSESICAQNNCRNGHLASYVGYSNCTARITANSSAEKSIVYEYCIPDPRTVFKHDAKPFLKSIGTSSCTIAVNASLPIPGFNNSRFELFVQVINSTGSLILDDSTAILSDPIPRIPARNSNPQATVTIAGLYPGQQYDITVRYRLEGSNYKTSVTHIQCQTIETAPIARPKIRPGGYIISNDDLILFPEEIPQYQYGAPKFEYEVTVKNDQIIGSVVSQSTLPIKLAFNSNYTRTVEIELKCKNRIGYCKDSDLLRLDYGTRMRKPSIVVARRLAQSAPSSRYFISWTPTSTATQYVLFWCRDWSSCPTAESTVVGAHRLNQIVCPQSDIKHIFVSACVNEQCGPMVHAIRRDNYEGPRTPERPGPVYDAEKGSLALMWTSLDEIDLVGFSPVTEYRFGGGHILATNDSRLSISCDQIMDGRIKEVSIRFVLKTTAPNLRFGPSSCTDSRASEFQYISEWSQVAVLTPAMCRLADTGYRTIWVAIVALLLAALTVTTMVMWGIITLNRMTNKLLRNMLNAIDQVESSYAQRKDAEEEQIRKAERWVLETCEAPIQYLDLTNSNGQQLRLPYLPPPSGRGRRNQRAAAQANANFNNDSDQDDRSSGAYAGVLSSTNSTLTSPVTTDESSRSQIETTQSSAPTEDGAAFGGSSHENDARILPASSAREASAQSSKTAESDPTFNESSHETDALIPLTGSGSGNYIGFHIRN